MPVATANWLKRNDIMCLSSDLKFTRLEKAVRVKENLQRDWSVEEFAALVLYKTGESMHSW